MAEPTPEDLKAAREALEAAVKAWLKVDAARPRGEDGTYATNDPVLNGWVLVANYSSVELEQGDLSATAYACGEFQPSPYSRGLASYGVEHW